MMYDMMYTLRYYIKIRFVGRRQEQTEFTAIARLLLNKFECHIFYMSFKETSLSA